MTDSRDSARYGPDMVSAGDKVRFEYGDRPSTSTKLVIDVNEWHVRVQGGGYVYYRDVKEIIPADTEGGDA